MVAKVAAHATFSTVIPPPGSAAARAAIFGRLRDPHLLPNELSPGSDMPMIHSDFYSSPSEQNEPLTKTQYAIIEKRKDGDFVNDWQQPHAPPRTITPAGLDRAALEACVGGAFYPGIEASWLLRDVYAYSEPFRLDPTGLAAGDVTKQMALPWQADFTDCAQDGALAWWPAQRPDDVFPEAGGPQVPWARKLHSDVTDMAMSDMVTRWHRLGFIVKKGAKYVEVSRL